MAVEDYNTYTEVEEDNRIVIATATHLDVNSIRNQTYYLYDDKLANHFGNFVHYVDFTKVDNTAGLHVLWMLSNSIGGSREIDTANGDFIAVFLYRNGGVGKDVLNLYECDAGTLHSQGGTVGTIGIGTMYYVRIEKDGVNLYLDVFSTIILRAAGSAGDGDVDSLSLVLQNDYQFQYVYAVNSWDSGHALAFNVDIENLDLREAVVVVKSSGSIVPIMKGVGML